MRMLRVVCGALVSIAASGTCVGAQEDLKKQYLRIELKEKLKPEVTFQLEAAIARVVKPSAGTAAFAKAAKGAMTLEQFCEGRLCSANFRRQLSAAANGQLPEIVAEAIGSRSTFPQTAQGENVLASVRIPSNLPAGKLVEDYLILKPGRVGTKSFGEILTQAGFAENQIAVVPVPGNEASLQPQAVELSGVAEPAIGAAVLENRAGAEVAMLKRDTDAFGATAQTIPIRPDASEADIAAIRQIVAAQQGSVTTLDNPRPDVDVVWPNEIVLSAAAADCDQLERWPLDAARIKDILEFDLAVLTGMGERYPRRSNILVIDTGIAPALAQLSEFRPFLFAEVRELMNAGRYYKKTDVSITGLRCDDADGEALGIAFGNAPASEFATDNRTHCDKDDLTELLAPPQPFEADGSTYVPEHGGFVGALAAGGLDLLAMRQDIPIDSLVGVSFARIMWMDQSAGPVRSLPADVARAFEYAAKKRVDVVNASLQVRKDPNTQLANAIKEYKKEGLLVAAAGNFDGKLVQDSSVFPASIAPPEGDDHVLLVGGLRRKSGGGDQVEFWPSSWSPQLVDIAAPAHKITSYDMTGQRTCMSGTSAAAPQVSFVAGVLRAFGLRSAPEIKRRILATADFAPELKEKVRDGRKLNVVNALDVFVDLVWLKGSSTPIRAHLLPPAGAKTVILRACADGSGSLEGDDGWIDAGRLLSWRRLDDDRIEIWHRRESTSITPLSNQCRAGPGDWKLHFRDLNAHRDEEKTLAEIDRLVPSPLRAALPTVRKIIGD